MKNKKLVIVGAGETAEIAYEYFTKDSEYEVVAFSVDRDYVKENSLLGLPIVPFDEIITRFPKEEYDVYCAISYTHLNRDRMKKFKECKELGYTCASYVSSHAFVWDNVEIGENTFVFEDNTIQYHAKIGNNVVLWSGNHVGHRSVIEDNVWMTSHIVVSGFCKIGNGSFIGVNATIGDNVQIAKDTVFGAGALTVKSITEEAGVYVGSPAKKLNRTSYEQFGVQEEIKE